tara:strand:- start:1177 stop:1836 length:660 start_codon:yes stop_codon:yes gene_type:complete
MSAVNKAAVAPAGRVRRDPVRVRASILRAAVAEFSDKGLGGARVDEIARRAGINKRMLYHYFGDKEALFLAALERAYEEIRNAERELHLGDLEPEEAMRRLVSFTFDYLARAPYFISLLNSENLHKARHLKKSARIRDMHSSMVDMIDGVLRRGVEKGLFRADADPVQLFITISGIAYFYFSNVHTLSAIFGRKFTSKDERAARHAHVVDAVMGYLRPL